MSEQLSISVRSRWTVIFPAVGAALGLVAAFIVGPVVAWLLGSVGDAPGPLRLAAELPLAWAIPVLVIGGAVGGLILLAQWHDNAGTVLIDASTVTVVQEKNKRQIARDRISGIFTDGQDLVMIDDTGAELLRTACDDEIAVQLDHALKTHSYPYLGAVDPRESEFVDWLDGADALDPESEALLRDRHRAKLDQKPGRTQKLGERLAEHGIVVRDRKEIQQYRVSSRK